MDDIKIGIKSGWKAQINTQNLNGYVLTLTEVLWDAVLIDFFDSEQFAFLDAILLEKTCNNTYMAETVLIRGNLPKKWRGLWVVFSRFSRLNFWSDEVIFKLNSTINQHNCMDWTNESPNIIEEKVISVSGVTVWCGLSSKRTIHTSLKICQRSDLLATVENYDSTS